MTPTSTELRMIHSNGIGESFRYPETVACILALPTTPHTGRLYQHGIIGQVQPIDDRHNVASDREKRQWSLASEIK